MADDITIKLPAELESKGRGAEVIGGVHLGKGRIQKIEQASLRKFLESAQAAGRTWLEVTQEAEQRKAEQNESAATEPDPEKRALNTYPADLVCQYCIRTINGIRKKFEQVEEWVDGAHPDVVDHVALEFIKASDLLEETEDAAGED